MHVMLRDVYALLALLLLLVYFRICPLANNTLNFNKCACTAIHVVARLLLEEEHLMFHA